MSESLKSIYVLLLLTGNACNSHDRCVAAGFDNGDIKLFDLRSMSLRWETNVRNGVCGHFSYSSIDLLIMHQVMLDAQLNFISDMVMVIKYLQVPKQVTSCFRFNFRSIDRSAVGTQV